MTTTPQRLPGKFVWFELASPDIALARAFYEPLFGWHVEQMPMGDRPYAMVMVGDQGIGGLRAAAAGEPAHWASYLSVADVDDRFQAALGAGARALMPPTDYGDVGRAAVLADPTGATFCLWAGAAGDRPDVDRVPWGAWCWNELWTTDADAALAFYRQVFGYTDDAMDMGAMGTYHVLRGPDGQRRAGLMQGTSPGVPSMWLPYLNVEHCDATVERARGLGARQVLVPPSDIPGIGRFAVLLDNQGAALAVIQPHPPAA